MNKEIRNQTPGCQEWSRAMNKPRTGFDGLRKEGGPFIGAVARFIARMLMVILLVVGRGHAQTTPGEQKTITLEELQQMALQNNPTFAEAAAGVRAAEGREKQSGLYPNPTVGYQGEQIRGGSFRGGEQGFFVQQDIVTAGKLGLTGNIFEKERKEAEAVAEEQKLRVMTSVKMGYIHALAAQQILDLRQHLSKLAQDSVETSRQLANVGQVDAPDILEAEAEEQQAELDVIMAEQNQRRAWQELAALVGKPRIPMMRLEGKLEDTPAVDADDLVEKIVSESPSVKIAELELAKAEAALARAKRESIPDLQLRGGLEENRELLDTTGRPAGLQGFAEAGVQIPIFNHNQGIIAASNVNIERARSEVERVKLALRQKAAAVAQNYTYSRVAVARYANEMIPRAQRAYKMYATQYQEMAAPYSQVLIAQRTLIQLQVGYARALENLATNSTALQSYLLTDGLDAPSEAGGSDHLAGQMNRSIQTGSSPKDR
jgi:cobalt-zinc-cadmium efflux system outer membrane protein